MKIVEGNVAVVTGAASGIGLAICEQLAQANVHVLMTDRNPDALAEVERQLAGDPRDPDELHDVLRRRGPGRPLR